MSDKPEDSTLSRPSVSRSVFIYYKEGKREEEGAQESALWFWRPAPRTRLGTLLRCLTALAYAVCKAAFRLIGVRQEFPIAISYGISHEKDRNIRQNHV